jgi:hypothetical protein
MIVDPDLMTMSTLPLQVQTVLGSALAMTYDVGYFWALDGICTKS